MNFNEPKNLASAQVENQEQGGQMETKHTPRPLTAKSWHVNAIFNGHIVGDETAEKFDKIHINGENRTIAVVFRPKDAREIADNHNSHASLTAALDQCVEALESLSWIFPEAPSPAHPTKLAWTRPQLDAYRKTTTALDAAKKARGE